MLDATPLLRLYARYRLGQLSAQNPAAIQESQLLGLLRKARSTRFGREHGFASISSVEEYQTRVPLRAYEEFWNGYWKEPFPKFAGATWPTPVKYIPVSSGTSSGTTKWIPCSPEMLRSNTKAGLDLLVHHLHCRPQSRIFGGKSFVLGGSTDLVERAPGIFSGDLSGIAANTLPWWVRPFYFPPQEIALLRDWEEKIEIMARSSLREDIRSISGVPNWILILFDKLSQMIPASAGRSRNLYPNLEMLVHGGVNFAPYRERFREILEGSRAELREVYPASEGFIAVADRGYGDGLRLILDHGVFFEFVPVEELHSKNPPRHWVKTIQPEVNYAVVLSTCAGVWSYLIGDTVRFVDTKIPRVLISGRTSYYMSAFGEHLIAEEVEDAVSVAANKVGAMVSDFAMGAIYPSRPHELGGHLYIVEFSPCAPPSTALDSFCTSLDNHLCLRNEDYEAHRQKNVGMREPTIVAVPPGTFAAWMKTRGKLGGQNKVPRIITNDDMLKDLSQFAKDHSAPQK